MAIKFKCPDCQTRLEAINDLADKKGSCPKCGKSLTVPQSDEGQTNPKEEVQKD